MTPPAYALVPEALWQRTSRRIVVNPPQGATFDLEGIPALVWEALAEPVTLDDLVDDLAAVFDRPPSAIRDEVEELLGDFMAAGVVLSG